MSFFLLLIVLANLLTPSEYPNLDLAFSLRCISVFLRLTLVSLIFYLMTQVLLFYLRLTRAIY